MIKQKQIENRLLYRLGQEEKSLNLKPGFLQSRVFEWVVSSPSEKEVMIK
jgi:hypothetical protein